MPGDTNAWLGTILSSSWSILAITLLASLVVGRLLLVIVRSIGERLARQSHNQFDDALVAALATPASLLLAAQSTRIAMRWIPLDGDQASLLSSFIGLATAALVLWTTFRMIDLVVGAMSTRPWAVDRPSTRSLLAIVGRFTKAFVLVLAGIVVLSYLGVSVGSLLAGLGIGGLALALAAQKTIENLFGTLSIGIDQPLREGDFVRIDDDVGTIEEVGLRSTRVRTLDRTLVTIPNGRLADQRIESFTARDRMRLACTLGLTYSTTAGQMRDTLADLEATLRAHPKIWPDAVVVRFKNFGDSSLDIEIMAWFLTGEWSEFQLIRQEILLSFMAVVERNGASFAFPTRTLHLASQASAA
jgi:MscS family membrane protein